MTSTRIIGLVFVVASISHTAFGQSLNERLILENPSKLVEESQTHGDIVRGAILFHQGNINCAKCHRPTTESDRVAPDLSRLPRETTNHSIVESILQPSKSINEDYQSIAVLTVDGKIITGMVTSEDESKVVLRTGQYSDQVVSISKQNIEERRRSTKSSMPDGLVNELKSRQQFLDLLRYVIDLRKIGPIATVDTHSTIQRELSDSMKGWVLIDRFNCTACHESKFPPSELATNRAPDLNWSATHLNPDYLADFIAEPQSMKPGTRMPHMLAQLSESGRKESARAIMHYLRSLNESQFEVPTDVVSDPAAVQRGNELFHTIGCVACHSPRNDQAMETGLKGSAPLGDLAKKYDSKGLVKFLEDPHAARPSGRMPNMVLTHREAKDLSDYLLQRRDSSPADSSRSWKMDTSLKNQGKRLFAELSCVQCHTGVGDTPQLNSRFASQTKLNQLAPNKGCLSDDAGRWPVFRLSSDERKQIHAALSNSAKQFTASQRIDLTLTSLNCTACHSRDNLGGVALDRRPYFQTTNLNLGEQGRIPPTLTGVGAKLQREWMRDVLVNHRSIRPYMKTRMPQYGERNIGHLIDLFQSNDHLSETEVAQVDDADETRKLGLEIVGNRGLNCVACHTYQYKLSDTMPAVDLTEMSKRLKKDWFHQYMLSPQRFSPGTVMPTYWPNGKAIRADLSGDPLSQVGAIWQYLLDGRQARAPRGVIREPLEIVVEDEARMLRRSYNGIGKRGIGVGFPGNVNLAFDAEQMRLAMIWRGKFVDPAGVWYGQGHGKVRTLGDAIDFAKGPELDESANPWMIDEARPPKHQFNGYVLDERRRPTFLYSFESVDVEDRSIEMPSEATESFDLRRRVKLTASRPSKPLRFRIAASEGIVALSDQSFRIGRRLTISIESGHVAKIVDENATKSLQIPLQFAAGESQELIIEYRWE